MPSHLLSQATALLQDEGGAVSLGWMYSLLLLVILGGLLSPQLPGKWEHARIHLPIDVPLLTFRILP